MHSAGRKAKTRKPVSAIVEKAAIVAVAVLMVAAWPFAAVADPASDGNAKQPGGTNTDPTAQLFAPDDSLPSCSEGDAFAEGVVQPDPTQMKSHEFRSSDGCDSVRITYDNLTSKIIYQDIAVIDFPCRIDRVLWISGEKTIIYLATAHITSPVHLYATDLNTNLTRDLTPFSGRSAADFSLTGKHKVLVLLNLKDKLHLDKCLVDIKTGALQLQEWNMRELENYDPDSHPVSALSNQESVQTAFVASAPDAFANAKDEFSQWKLHWNQTQAPPQNFSVHYAGSLFNSAQTARPAGPPLDGQQKIKDENPDLVKNTFVFVDPNDPRCKFLNFASRDLKPWTAGDKAKIESALNGVANTAPVLILRAVHGQKIYLARCDFLYKDPATVPPLTGGDYFEACAADNAITIANIFFTDPHRDSSIAHELGHLIDLRGHYSLTPEFISHAAPRIAAFRQIIKLNKAEEVSVPIDEYCTKYFGLPCSYAATNLREAFAEMVSQVAYNPSARKGPIYELLKKWVFVPPGVASANEDLLLKSIHLDNNHKYAESKHLADQAIKADPSWMLAYDARSRVLMNLDQPPAALADSDKAIGLLKQRQINDYNYDVSQLYFHRYQILRKLHRHKEALSAIKLAIATSPGVNSQFLWGEIQAYDDLGDGQRALPIADQLVKQFPNDMQNYLLRVFLRIDYFHSRNIQADLDKAASLKKNGADCTLMRAVCLQKLNKVDQAMPLLDEAIKDDPQNACALFHRGQCYQDLHKYSAAISDYSASGRVDSYYASICKSKILACTAALKGHAEGASHVHGRRAASGSNRRI
jgi:tetratricopeptide (TPR) repeat protein